MSIIAVSGASGFVGRHLCAALTAHGHRPVAVTREMLLGPDPARGLTGAESFVHLAARAHVLADSSADPAAEFHASNVDLTITAARACMQAGVGCFVFLSSAGVLGASSPPQGFDEDSPPDPHDAYTASKLEAEHRLAAELPAPMRLAILRPPLIHGSGARGNLMRLLRLALHGWPLPIGALHAPRSMIGVRNMVDLILTASTDVRIGRLTMLAADRETLSVADLYAAVAEAAGHHPWLAPFPAVVIRALLRLAGRARDVPRLTAPFVLRPTAARRVLGWEPPYALADELRAMVREELAARR